MATVRIGPTSRRRYLLCIQCYTVRGAAKSFGWAYVTYSKARQQMAIAGKIWYCPSCCGTQNEPIPFIELGVI